MWDCIGIGSILTVPFALTLAAPAQGMLVTSATLRDPPSATGQ